MSASRRPMIAVLAMLAMACPQLAAARGGASSTTDVPPSEAEEGDVASARRATVRVDTREVEDGASVIERRILERSSVVLRSAQVLPAEAPDDPIIMVRVRELGANKPGYAFVMEIRVNDATHGKPAEVMCDLCTEGELVERVEDRLASLLDELHERGGEVPEPDPPPASEPPSSDAPELPAQDVSSTTPEDRGGLQAKGKAGAALLVLGGLSVAAGAGLAAVPPSTKAEMPLEKTTMRPPGLALLGVGGAALITGAVLLVLDRKEAKKKKTVAILPAGMGATILGRF